MALSETEGLVLKSFNLADADKIVVFLTQNNGLIRGVAKGAKRLKSKFNGSLEPFSVVNLAYFQKDQRELVSIRQIDLKKSFFNHASDLIFLQKFAYIAELLIEFVPPNDPNERLYKMSKVCLETASTNLENLEAISLYFELWLLRLGGYLPNWAACFNCNSDFNDNEITNLQYDFHLYCSKCQNVKQRFIIDPNQRYVFQLAQTVSPKKFIELTKGYQNEFKEVSGVLKRIISHSLGKDIVERKILTN